MKQLLTIALSAMFMLNITFAQNQIASKKQERAKNPYHVSLKGINVITGDITGNTNYISGSTMILDFVLSYTTPDLEYVDGFSMTFPAGIEPQETGTTTTIDGASLATPVSGQTVVWGQVTTPSGYGDIEPGTYPFSVSVTIDATVTGAQSVTYFIMGDGYGAAPNSITGSISILEAAAADVGVVSVDMNTSYQPAAVAVPMATIQNFGTQDQSFDVTVTIDDGTAQVFTDTFNIVNLAVGATQQITFLNTWTTATGNYTAVVETHLAGDAYPNNNIKSLNILVIDDFTAYAWNAYDPNDVLDEGPIEVLIPSAALTQITASTLDFIAGADFVENLWIGAEFNAAGNSTIYSIDINTGSTTPIGPSGVNITGLAYDVVTSTLYASVWANSETFLYTIDVLTGTATATLIGPMGATSGLVIGIAANANGDIFGVSLNDSLVSIDKTTGAATVIGPLGIDISYAQDIAYDRDNDVLYGTLYTAQGGLLAFINTTTGTATTLDTFPQELTGFAIPYTFTVPDNDVMVHMIHPIASGCNLGNNIDIVITVANMGTLDQTDIPVYYTINGGAQVTGTVAGTLAAGATTTYTFTQTVDLSSVGAYTIMACTDLANDDNPGNDCKTIIVNNIAPVSVPYTMGFEATDDFSGWLIEDVNADAFTWEIIDFVDLANTGSGLAVYEYNPNSNANDWLISTCIELQAGTNYDLSFWYQVGEWQGIAFPEKMKVAMGTAQTSTALTQLIVDLGTINNTTYQNSKTIFTVPTTGVYYIGWHAYSDADQFFIALDDISIDIATSAENKGNESSVFIYPNPVKNVLHINASSQIENVRIVNALGQLVKEFKVDALSYSVNTSDYKYGMYLIQIETTEGITNKRFVVVE